MSELQEQFKNLLYLNHQLEESLGKASKLCTATEDWEKLFGVVVLCASFNQENLTQTANCKLLKPCVFLRSRASLRNRNETFRLMSLIFLFQNKIDEIVLVAKLELQKK